MDSSTDRTATNATEVELWPIPLAEAQASPGGTRALVRSVLLRYVPALEDAAFATAEAGKPYLAGSAWSYNVSHAGDWLVLALSRGREIGVDVEPVAELSDVDRLVGAYCSAAERRTLGELNGAEKSRAFLRLWVRKEALGKAHGSGFVDDPAAVPALAGTVAFANRTWTVADFTLAPDHVAAVAVGGPEPYSLTFRAWPLIFQGA